MDTEAEVFVAERFRGGTTPEAELEDAVNDVFGVDFLKANGLSVPEDEAEVEDPACSRTGRWSDQRLDAPVHAYTKVTVRELVYTLMKICAGAVKATQMDEIIKSFKRTLPDGNDMPGYKVLPHLMLAHNSSYLPHTAVIPLIVRTIYSIIYHTMYKIMDYTDSFKHVYTIMWHDT